jgi:hypothetical protein
MLQGVFVSVVETVIKRIEGGARARFFMDHFGGQWVELRGRVLFWRRQKIQLANTQIEEIKTHLRSRSQRRAL